MECSVSLAHKTWSRSLLFFKRFSCVSASQDPGGHAISRQKIARVAFAFTGDICFPDGGTHITRDMCFPGVGSTYH